MQETEKYAYVEYPYFRIMYIRFLKNYSHPHMLHDICD